MSDGPIDLGRVRESARKELLKLLDGCEGTKALVWDLPLTDRFGLIVEFSLLQEHGVKRMFQLTGGKLSKSDVEHIIFITRPHVDMMDLIAQNIQREEESPGFEKEFHIFFVPSKSFQCKQKLEELGVANALTSIEEFRMDMIPLDCDVLSMELPYSLVDCLIHEDHSSLYFVARALNGLQKQFGAIPQINGAGKYARTVCDYLKKIQQESGTDKEDIRPEIDRLLILDRTVDFVSPLVTQLTYEGLIDEVYGIHNATGQFPPERFSSDKKQEEDSKQNKKVILSSKDDLFQHLRDKNFNAVGPVLKSKAKQITEQYEERHSAKTVREMKHFVKNLPQMQEMKSCLANHTAIAELIKEFTDTEGFLDTISLEQELLNGVGTDKVNQYIEDCLFRKEPLTKLLRLLCLQCLTNNGLKPKVLEYYKKEIIHTYGFEHIITIRNLERAGLLQAPCKLWNYNTIRKSLRLIVEEINEKDPKDIAYVHSGYAPLSARLVQIFSHPGWRSIEEVFRLLPGSLMSPVKQSPSRKKWLSSPGGKDTIVTLVFFIGGVTYAEISALRFLGDLESGGPKEEYVIASTSIINGNTMMRGFIESCNDKSM